MGVSQVFSYKLTAAEENLTHALKQFEKHGLEMEVKKVYRKSHLIACTTA